jgi:hypothetical protein
MELIELLNDQARYARWRYSTDVIRHPEGRALR